MYPGMGIDERASDRPPPPLVWWLAYLNPIQWLGTKVAPAHGCSASDWHRRAMYLARHRGPVLTPSIFVVVLASCHLFSMSSTVRIPASLQACRTCVQRSGTPRYDAVCFVADGRRRWSRPCASRASSRGCDRVSTAHPSQRHSETLRGASRVRAGAIEWRPTLPTFERVVAARWRVVAAPPGTRRRARRPPTNDQPSSSRPNSLHPGGGDGMVAE